MQRCFFLLMVSLAAVLFLSLSASYAADSWPHKEQLQDEIAFWKNVFIHYDDDQYVLHDPADLGIVYKVVSFDPETPPRKRKQRLAAEKDETTKTLIRIAKKTQSNAPLTQVEQKIARLFEGPMTPQKYRICAYRVRAQQGIANRFTEGLKRSFTYLPAIKKIFRDNGMPETLAYLPHVESSFNPHARSKAGAAGMWQFVRKTACLFMKVNSVIDERYDPIASTEAACALLKLNYQETKDWGLAITAYNHGLTGMKEASQRHGRDYMAVRKKYRSPSFQFASKNFYPEFLAAVDIMANLEKHFPDVKPADDSHIVRFRIKKPVVLPRLAKSCNIDLARLKEFNSGYTSRVWSGRAPVPAGFYINLPSKVDLALVTQYIDEEPLPASDHKKARRAQRVAGKAAASGPPQKALARQKEKAPLKAAVRRQADRQETAEAAPVAASGAKQKAGPGAAQSLSMDNLKKELAPVLAVKNRTISVFGNETLGHYAQWLKISSQELCRLNSLSAKKPLRQKQTIRVDLSRVSPDEFERHRTSYHLSAIEQLLREHNLDRLIDYTLREGESPGLVAERQFNIPTSLVLYFNSGQNLRAMRPGSVIRIPVSRSQAADNQNS